MSGGLIIATFVEQGTLGLKFAPLEQAAQVGVHILSINPGTQAAMQPRLRPGLKLLSVESQGQTRWTCFAPHPPPHHTHR
jgi:hypothetical protein